MRKVRQVLLAGVMTPALVLAQAASAGAAPLVLAQAQPEQKPHEAPKPAAPHAPPVAPPPPRAAPPAAPHVAPPPAAPRIAPPPQAAPPAAPRVAPPPIPHAPPPSAAPHPAPAPIPHAPPAAAPHPVAPPTAPRPAPTTAPPAVRPPPVVPHAAPQPGATPPSPGAPRVIPVTPAPVAPQNVAPRAAPPSSAPLPNAAPNRVPPPGASPSAPAARPATPPPAQPGVAPLAPVPPAPAGAAPMRVPDGPATGQQPTPLRPGAPPPPAGAPQSGARGSRLTPAGAAALGAAAGLVGGFMAAQPGAAPRALDAVRQQRREFSAGGANVFQEPGRTIVQDDNRFFVRHDENERFRQLGANLQSERRGDDIVTIWRRPDGDEIVTVTDANGNLLRRYRRAPDGAEVVIIDNRFSGPPRAFIDNVVVLPPPAYRIAPERYIVDADMADERVLYDTLSAPPVAPIPRRFTLDEIRYSPDVRAYTRSVDINTVNFETNSWAVAPDQAQKLAALARAINEAIGRNPNEVFLVEGHTDAVGNPVDNLSLSDRRAQSVADVLTRDFAVPPENLVTQGYGAQNLRVQTGEAERRNRRVVVRRITPLLNGQNGG
jgi:outer membrane protein OmpA-like peptidoglycan-associated protein